jgi:iron complex transport system substrate-binding protein
MDRKPLILLVIILAIALSAAQIWPNGPHRDTPPLPRASGAVEPAKTARQLTDQTGHKLNLPEQVRRVGTPGISMASLILALGGPQELAAVAPEVRDNPWLRHIEPSLSQRATPFTRPAGVSIEQLLAAKPDMVVLWTGNALLAKQIEAAGVPVFSMGYTNAEEMKRAIVTLGQALGATELSRANELVTYYDNNLNRVSATLVNLPEHAKPSVYYASIAPLYTEGSASMIDAWITAAGGVNVAARGGLKGDGQVHMEDVVRWDPEFIITLDASQRQSILQDIRWQGIRAVRDHHVLVNPKGINAWCTRAAEASLQLLWAAKTLHPALFRDLDIGAETRTFYHKFYAYELNNDELNRILNGQPPPQRANQTSQPTRTRSQR